LTALTIQQRGETAPADKRAAHYRLFGMEPGERPLDARKGARRIVETIAPRLSAGRAAGRIGPVHGVV